jgi:hypothetical protein
MCLTGKANFLQLKSVLSFCIIINADEGESASMTWHLPIPENAVPDSARGELAVIGDVMGPSLEVRHHITRSSGNTCRFRFMQLARLT